MASRQNRETRKEYPTGHNKGNDSPSRAVPRTNGGNDDDEPVQSFGAPIGAPPPVRDTDEERQRLLQTTGEGGTAAEHIEEAISEGQAETRERAEQEAANRPAGAVEEPSPTADLTVTTAIERIKDRQQQQQETDR